MSLDQDTDREDGSEKKLTQKEFAKKLRREAYLRAKEYKKNDPREIARKAKAKEQRKETYQKAKERSKTARQDKKEKEKELNKIDLQDHIVRAVVLDERPMAPVISLDSVRKKNALQKPLRVDD